MAEGTGIIDEIAALFGSDLVRIAKQRDEARRAADAALRAALGTPEHHHS